jgi:hypothetical protein
MRRPSRAQRPFAPPLPTPARPAPATDGQPGAPPPGGGGQAPLHSVWAMDAGGMWTVVILFCILVAAVRPALACLVAALPRSA